jgi:hypothetical protein
MDLLPIIPSIDFVVQPPQLYTLATDLSNVSPDSNVPFDLGFIAAPVSVGNDGISVPKQYLVNIEIGFDAANPCTFKIGLSPDSNASNITLYSREFTTALSNTYMAASCSLLAVEGVDFTAGDAIWVFLTGTSNVPTFDSNVSVKGSLLASSLP